MEGLNSSLVFLVLVGLVFYLMLYRPNKKRIDQHRRLIDSVEVGDEIVTIGGMFGHVREITDEHFLVEVAPGSNVRFAKSAIARRLEPDTQGASEDSAGSMEETQG